MKRERAYNTTLDKIFAELLAELEKQPISRNKAIELERRFLSTMNNAYGVESETNKSVLDSGNLNEEISLDMNKLLRDKSLFTLSSIPHKVTSWVLILVLSFVGILFITVGFLLIITPASAEFEIATLFYFNEYDGFTVMDLIALIIVFIGIYFFLRAFVATDKRD
ncbi:MAG: hypothetical protein EAZ13_04895 [Sphingobacteriia bacterium]|nr:MAG: hypothetical protein EAZ41_10515 [Sphingobacteriia bacterium]TAG31813.1 MAG: hypothetical protein EAZ35_01805 [Sphingobacteriia bacterium]TAH07822.1 MAG: hypothetical protein EAZ13_04895 [Sphingobacteriia bacterium]